MRSSETVRERYKKTDFRNKYKLDKRSQIVKKISLLSALTLLAMLGSSPAFAENASCEEAKAMAEKAAALVKSEGADKAYATFMDEKGGFRDRDLYVFAFDPKGVYKVHATKPAMVGKDGSGLKDANGVAFVQNILAVKEAGWVEYSYPDPSDGGKVKPKKSYVIRVADDVLGVGCYVK